MKTLKELEDEWCIRHQGQFNKREAFQDAFRSGQHKGMVEAAKNCRDSIQPTGVYFSAIILTAAEKYK